VGVISANDNAEALIQPMRRLRRLGEVVVRPYAHV
jgi:hypothetical protein